MQAYSYSKYGPPEVVKLVELPKPEPKENEVLIRVHATTVSSGDWRVRSMTLPAGMGLIGRLAFGITGPRKQVLGTELSGVIESVGTLVSRFKPGDAVVAFPGGRMGAHAEYITMPAAGSITHKPDNLSFEQAAALLFGGTTAYDFLFNKAGLKAGERVLINGASGSTGIACVQMAANAGAHVTAVCSGANEALVKLHGAETVIDYKATDFTQGDETYDMIVDTAGTAPWHRSKHALAPKGRLVVISGGLSDMVFGWLKTMGSGKKIVGGVAGETLTLVKQVVAMAEAGDYTPVIDRVYPFAGMIDAHRHVDTGRKKGNVVVSFVPSE